LANKKGPTIKTDGGRAMPQMMRPQERGFSHE